MNAAAQLSRELIEDAIILTHPDKHPEERAVRANRVTAELLALRQHARPRAEEKPGDQQFPFWVTARTISATGLVVAEPVFLLNIKIDSVAEGSSLVLFDGRAEGNPSTGEIKPHAGTRWLAIHHRTAIYVRIRGEMSITFFYLR
jgi:hypothetical protein